jgi:hypothetical protein
LVVGLVSLAAAFAALPVVASPDFEAMVPCADVVGGQGSLLSGNLNVVVLLAEPACEHGISYNLVAYADATMTQVVGSTSSHTALGNVVNLNTTVTDADGIVCIVVTTNRGQGPLVIDRAPDTGCTPVAASTPGFTGFS